MLIYVAFLKNLRQMLKSWSSFSLTFMAVYPFLVMQWTSSCNEFLHSFFKQVCFCFFKYAYVLLVFFNWVPHMQILDMILGVNIICWKVSIASINGAGALGVFWNPNWDFRQRSILRGFLGFKEHLDWLTVDFNLAKIIIVEDYNNNKN